ncbi:MAG TPA: hypothetical protein VI256_14185 [Roseiarcus sp.]
MLDGWFKNKDRKNNTIKMNTGAGKTVVGLLVLQSSLNEKIYPAVFLNRLVQSWPRLVNTFTWALARCTWTR